MSSLWTGLPEGFDALLLAERQQNCGSRSLLVTHDGTRAERLVQQLQFFCPELQVHLFPAWDVLPFDRVSPSPDIVSRRLSTLERITRQEEEPLFLVTTINALSQRVPTKNFIKEHILKLAVGREIRVERLLRWLANQGYLRTGTVRESGEFAVRGGIIDIFPSGRLAPIRIDLFGSQIESMHRFDPESQLRTKAIKGFILLPATEYGLDSRTTAQFRQKYLARFGASASDDPMLEAISAGQRFRGAEHLLPLFHDHLTTLTDFTSFSEIYMTELSLAAADERRGEITDYHQARLHQEGRGDTYRLIQPKELYLSENDWTQLQNQSTILTADIRPEANHITQFDGKRTKDYTSERKQKGTNIFSVFVQDLLEILSTKKVILACHTEGSRDRMMALLRDQGFERAVAADSWLDAHKLDKRLMPVIVLSLEHGFETRDLCVIGEADVVGMRMIRKTKRRNAERFLAEASSLHPGDLVVHIDHGIGRYLGLETLEVGGAPHDCLHLEYHGGDKLYLPVENIDRLTRYGGDDVMAHLDRLGGVAWQAKKAKLKEKIAEMAEGLMKTAALRKLKQAPQFDGHDAIFHDFCARFPYDETEDQLRAIGEVVSDLHRGIPMDRLICGDVGFGKTEVALRAAFLVAIQGKQVALVVPTTLLARQHTRNFEERFEGWPIHIGQLSRMVSQRESNAVKEGLKDGHIDLVIGTHALFSKDVQFRDLGLVIIDEEQHFGVAHKEKLKQLRADVHVLTLSATPIPRTLQLALSGARDLSLITTPPVDRLAVRTYVSPFDAVMIREALLREKYRGGQSFLVVPRIKDLRDMEEFLREQVPEITFRTGHGQMPSGELDDIMNGYYDGRYDVLLATTIIESGLDIPSANTMIIHHADQFGLAQLYQLRGRVGRSKVRGYTYLTTSPRKMLTTSAEKRLQILQSLDSLGAGFTLASHDLDLRGAGNLLGDDQSGHIKEVGFELYQSMLEDAVAELSSQDGSTEHSSHQFSPSINLDLSVLIPQNYVADLDLRLSLYRRLGELDDHEMVDQFGAELIDRFGPLPVEVDHLLRVIKLKNSCRQAKIDRIDAGPKGVLLGFFNDQFENPTGLLSFIHQSRGSIRVRPDHRLVITKTWTSPLARLKGLHQIVDELVSIAQHTKD